MNSAYTYEHAYTYDQYVNLWTVRTLMNSAYTYVQCVHLWTVRTLMNSAYTYEQCVHLWTVRTLMNSAYIYEHCVHLWTVRTLMNSAYTYVQCVHLWTVRTLMNSAYTYEQCVHLWTVPTLMYSTYTYEQCVHLWTFNDAVSDVESFHIWTGKTLNEVVMACIRVLVWHLVGRCQVQPRNVPGQSVSRPGVEPGTPRNTRPIVTVWANCLHNATVNFLLNLTGITWFVCD
jgi:hypothetical protein